MNEKAGIFLVKSGIFLKNCNDGSSHCFEWEKDLFFQLLKEIFIQYWALIKYLPFGGFYFWKIPNILAVRKYGQSGFLFSSLKVTAAQSVIGVYTISARLNTNWNFYNKVVNLKHGVRVLYRWLRSEKCTWKGEPEMRGGLLQGTFMYLAVWIQENSWSCTTLILFLMTNRFRNTFSE